ncbi:MAG: hypothetical protein AB1546_15035 [bacterium]
MIFPIRSRKERKGARKERKEYTYNYLFPNFAHALRPLREFTISLILAVLSYSLIAAPSNATDFHGFYQANYSLRLPDGDKRCQPGQTEACRREFILGEERLQLKFTPFAASETTDSFAKVDFYHDSVSDSFKGDIREAYLDYFADTYDIRVGRQIITWGLGDLLFINDVYPKNWVAFLSGAQMQYLKTGSDALKLNIYREKRNFEFVAIPFFEADIVPDGQRLLYYDPIAAIQNRSTSKPKQKIENTEAALRISQRVGDFDTSLYLFRGFYKTPSVDIAPGDTSLTFYYPRLNLYGFSAQGACKNGVLSIEGGYLESVTDKNGGNPNVPNSQIRFLLGFQKELKTDFTAGFQYYIEAMRDHGSYTKTLPAGFPAQDKLRHLVTLRLTRLADYQTTKMSVMSFYSPSDSDYYLNPDISHNYSDQLSLTAGLNIFGGKERHTFFGQFDKNDNLYVRVEYHF